MTEHEPEQDEELEVAEADDATHHEARHTAKTFVAGLAIGALVGAGLALLFAPQSGEEARRVIKRRAKRLAAETRDRYDEVKDRLRREHRRRGREESSAE